MRLTESQMAEPKLQPKLQNFFGSVNQTEFFRETNQLKKSN